MEIPRIKEVKYGYACPCCGAILADNLDRWPLNLTVICSECDACFNSDNAVRKVQDIELEEPGKEYHGMIPNPSKVSVEGQNSTTDAHLVLDSTPAWQTSGGGFEIIDDPKCILPVDEDEQAQVEHAKSNDIPIYQNMKTGDIHFGEPPAPKTHDSIYKQIEDRCGVSHSALVEDIIQRGDIPTVSALYLALASKYLVRVGCKEEWEKDAGKLLNYVHKAVTGRWFNEGGSDDSE